MMDEFKAMFASKRFWGPTIIASLVVTIAGLIFNEDPQGFTFFVGILLGFFLRRNDW